MRRGVSSLGVVSLWFLAFFGCGEGEGSDGSSDDDSSPVGDDDSTPPPDDDSTPLVDDDSTPDDDTTLPTDDDTASDDDSSPVWVPGRRLLGSVTWKVDVDEAGEAAGHPDCTYTREYDLLETRETPWLCPDCEALFTGVSVMTAGYEECYLPTLGGEAEQVEHLGFSYSDPEEGVARFFRTTIENHPLGAIDEEVTGEEGETLAVDWTSDLELADASGALHLTVTGSLLSTWEKGLEIIDPLPPRTAPYACGWPLGNPGGAETVPYTPELGEILPDAVLEDHCGEGVHLWDFFGEYLVIDASTPDCPACITMAGAEEDFLAEMAALELPTRIITLMGHSLADPLQPADPLDVTEWLEDHDLEGPVLRDRGYGYSVIAPMAPEDWGYPTWMVTAPDLTVLRVNVGYGEDSFETIKALITSHAAGG